MKRTVLLVALVLVASLGLAGTGYYLWRAGSVRDRTPPPPMPAELTDPPVRKLIEEKRQAVLTAQGGGGASAKSLGTAWGELGMAFDAHEAAPEAIACYHKAMELDPRDARWPFLLASQFDREGNSLADRKEAAELYRRATQCQAPSSAHWATALLWLADLLTELGRRDEAAPLYERVYASEPSDPRAAYRMAMMLADRDPPRAGEAAQLLLRLTRNPYTRKKATIALAELSRRTGRMKEAEEFEHAAGLLSPDQHWANPFSEEVAELRRGRRALMDEYTAAVAQQDRAATVRTATALADQYPSVETQMLLLRALVNARHYPAALAVADHILRDENGRRMSTAHAFLGLARIGVADQAEAEGRKADADRLLAQAADSLQESVRLRPDYGPGYLDRAKALLRLGRLPEAEEAARGGVRSRPEEWEMYLVLADVLSAEGRKADAITAAEQAVKLAHPDETRPKQALEALKE